MSNKLEAIVATLFACFICGVIGYGTGNCNRTPNPRVQACLQERAQEKQAIVEHRENCDKARKAALECVKKLEKDRFEWGYRSHEFYPDNCEHKAQLEYNCMHWPEATDREPFHIDSCEREVSE